MERSGQFDAQMGNQTAKRAVLSSFAQLGARLKTAKVPDSRLHNMVDTIEGEILPRLMLTFLDAGDIKGDVITELDRAEFLKLVLSASADDMQRFMEDLVRRGVPEEAVLADLLATAARRLGELWEEDYCDFTVVALGLCRLHEVLRHASVRGDISFVRTETHAPSVLLTNGPLDQHVFGLLMVAEFFRRDGWRVWSEPGADLDHICSIVRRESIDVVGLSLGCMPEVREVRQFVLAIRDAAMVSDLKVFLGGHAVLTDNTLVTQSGADGWAKDAVTAPDACRALLADRN
ncbi:MAG: cobalamin B12-binding domain-containing protein [Pseudomonadota bacterium]